MPKYYCDYCDTYLTHDSPSVRKTHNQGKKHRENVKDYYMKWVADQTQRLINQTIKQAGKSSAPASTTFQVGTPSVSAAMPVAVQGMMPSSGMTMTMSMPPPGMMMPPMGPSMMSSVGHPIMSNTR